MLHQNLHQIAHFVTLKLKLLCTLHIIGGSCASDIALVKAGDQPDGDVSQRKLRPIAVGRHPCRTSVPRPGRPAAKEPTFTRVFDRQSPCLCYVWRLVAALAMHLCPIPPDQLPPRTTQIHLGFSPATPRTG